jgi:hypothetical protein
VGGNGQSVTLGLLVAGLVCTGVSLFGGEGWMEGESWVPGVLVCLSRLIYVCGACVSSQGHVLTAPMLPMCVTALAPNC